LQLLDQRQASEILSGLDRDGLFPAAAATDAAAWARLLFDLCRERGFHPDLPAFQLLCRLATAPDHEVATAATTEIYRQVIEPLCDDFTRAGTVQAHLVLAGFVTYLAGTGQGRDLAAKLRRAALITPSLMLDHWQQAVSPLNFPARAALKQLEKILIPSRITAGADVAITSVLIGRLRQAVPQAEIVLIGPNHLAELFAGLSGVRHLPFRLHRHGSLHERLLYYPALLAATATEIEGMPPNRVLALDPDSRLTQLGLLPLAIPASTCQFPSQSLGEADEDQSLSGLANFWLDGMLGEAAPVYPFISPPRPARAAAAAFCGRLRQEGSRLFLVNLGVGGNSRKRLPDELELLLLGRLLEQKNTTIILDMGCGSEEKGRAEKLLRRHNGSMAPDLGWQPVSAGSGRPGLIGLCASLGELAAVCGEADGYLGYDSCGQHLANAATIPGVTIFTGHPNRRFLARWSPWSRKKISAVIPVDRNTATRPELTAAIDRALLALNHLTAQRFS
jgi:ADP-heptose:LPS heptosyltransferase